MTRDETQQTVRRLVLRDFGWEIQKGLELALLRSFAVPSVSGLLAGTGQLSRETASRVRRTDEIIMRLLVGGYGSLEGIGSLERINAAHARFGITNEQYLFVLSTFLLQPLGFIERFGWRRLFPAEREAWFAFWREVGKAMSIRDIPETLTGFEAWAREFEERSVRPAASNEEVARPVVGFMKQQYAWPVRTDAVGAMYYRALLGERAGAALGLEKPAGAFVLAVQVILGARAGLVRFRRNLTG